MKTINQDVDLSHLYFKALPEWLSEVRVNGSFWCNNNQLTSLEGSPEKVGGDFYCYNNPGKFTKEDVRKVCNVKGGIYITK